MSTHTLTWCPACGRDTNSVTLIVGDTITFSCEGHNPLALQIIAAPKERPPSLSSLWRCKCGQTNWYDEYTCPKCYRKKTWQ